MTELKYFGRGSNYPERITVVFDPQYHDCWFDYENREGKEPTIRVDVCREARGEFHYIPIDEAVRCSSGTITPKFLQIIELVKRIYSDLRLSVFLKSEPKPLFERVSQILFEAGFIDLQTVKEVEQEKENASFILLEDITNSDKEVIAKFRECVKLLGKDENGCLVETVDGRVSFYVDEILLKKH